MQITVEGTTIEFSKPLESIRSDPPKEPVMPKSPERPQEPKPLNGWKRFMNTITFGRAYKKDFAEYKEKTETFQKNMVQFEKDFLKYEEAKEQYEKDHAKYEEDMRAYSNQESIQKGLDGMKAERWNADLEAEADRERKEELKQYDAVKSKDTYGSELDAQLNAVSNYYGPKPELDKEHAIRAGGKDGPYTLDQFGELPDINIEQIKIGGEQLTGDQFASIAMCATLMKMTKDKTPSPDVAEYTCDLAGNPNGDGTFRPRNQAGKHFATAIHPGRMDAVQALVEYRLNRPEKLAEMIVYGAELQLKNTRHNTIKQTSNLVNDVMVSRTWDLLQKDTKLFQAAIDAGLSNAHIEAMQGAKAMADIYRENERATKLMQLADKSNYLPEISKEEREGCIQSRLRFEVAENSLQEQNFEAQEKAQEMGFADIYRAAGKGGVGAIDKLGKGLLPNQDKLMDLKGKDLEEALSYDKLFSGKSEYAKEQPQKTEPTVRKEVTKVKTTDSLEVR